LRKRSASLRHAATDADIGNSPHGTAALCILAIDVRVERHVDELVENVNCCCTTGSCCAVGTGGQEGRIGRLDLGEGACNTLGDGVRNVVQQGIETVR